MAYQFEHGYTDHEKQVALQANPTLSFVKTTDNEWFRLSRIYNDSEKACYKLVTNSYNGRTFNVNMNSGIAYYTTLKR